MENAWRNISGSRPGSRVRSIYVRPGLSRVLTVRAEPGPRIAAGSEFLTAGGITGRSDASRLEGMGGRLRALQGCVKRQWVSGRNIARERVRARPLPIGRS